MLFQRGLVPSSVQQLNAQLLYFLLLCRERDVFALDLFILVELQ
jgi:hypothetical protein